MLLTDTPVTPDQIERARRVADRMRIPKPVTEVLVDLGQLARSDLERLLRKRRSMLEVADILHEKGALAEEALAQYRDARAGSPRAHERELLVDSGLVGDEAYLRAVCDKHGFPYVEPEVVLVDAAVLAKVSFPYLQRRKVLPLRIDDGVLTVAMNDPREEELVRELERLYGVKVLPCGATAEAIAATLAHLFRQTAGSGVVTDDSGPIKYREIREVDDGEEIGAEAVRIVDHLLSRAFKMKASDLHIEPRERELVVRIRIDGVLQHLTTLPAQIAPRVAARVKVLCGADLAERRIHQDGRIFAKVDGMEVDMRVSTYASMFGETVVIRLLSREQGLLPIDALGFQPSIMSGLRDVSLRASSGLMLITGPTGSGKTTTLYSFVDSLLDGSRKVITCEDPVEYVLEGTTQCSVSVRAGTTFADSLRAMVRQDPDIIVIGEVRDKVTAEMAVEAALTGHKVLSTFHTEDSLSAVVRLLEMGVEPFLVASTLECVIAQRLVRRLCTECSRQGRPAKRDLRYLGYGRDELGGAPVPEQVGCPRCNNTGYRGRLGVYEVLLPDDDLRDAILRRAPVKELRAVAKQLPTFLSLVEDGLLKVVAGVTTLSELADHVPRDPDPRPLTAIRDIAQRRGIE
jgi:type IV pilus assembly protein PilB